MNSIDTLSVINLIIYTLLWIWTFRSYYKKKRTIDSGGVIILLFCLYAVCGCFLYIDEWIGETYNKYPLSLFLFVYLYIMLLVSIYPHMLPIRWKMHQLRFWHWSIYYRKKRCSLLSCSRQSQRASGKDEWKRSLTGCSWTVHTMRTA